MLTVAGFDPSSGAGVTADLSVFAAYGFHGAACVTALTVQSTVGVRAVHPVDAVTVRETLDCLWDDVPAAGIKIGMLASAEVVRAVAEFLAKLRRDGSRVPVVLDPVLRSSSGRELLSAEGIEELKRSLLPLVDWVTPNLPELGLLTGMSAVTAAGTEEAAAALQGSYPGVGLVVTGGHLEERSDETSDLVVDAEGVRTWVRGERIASRATHGTGCAYSSALACGLAKGVDAVGAAEAAKRFVTEGIRRAATVGRGRGPMKLLWPLEDRVSG